MLNKNRKSQGLPLNTIIIAAIALVVLVVILLIFSDNIRDFSKNMKSCTAKGGECIDKGLCIGDKADLGQKDCKEGKTCCMEISGTKET